MAITQEDTKKILELVKENRVARLVVNALADRDRDRDKTDLWAFYTTSIIPKDKHVPFEQVCQVFNKLSYFGVGVYVVNPAISTRPGFHWGYSLTEFGKAAKAGLALHTLPIRKPTKEPQIPERLPLADKAAIESLIEETKTTKKESRMPQPMMREARLAADERVNERINESRIMVHPETNQLSLRDKFLASKQESKAETPSTMKFGSIIQINIQASEGAFSVQDLKDIMEFAANLKKSKDV